MTRLVESPSNERYQGSMYWIIAVLYVALLAFHGYAFGDGDMTETLSYALYLKDPTLFSTDFYIQTIGQDLLNPRLPFTLLLYPFIDHLDWAAFVFHLVSTLILLAGWIRLGSRYIKSSLWLIIWLLSFLFVSYHVNLGGNEAWYYFFVPSHLAKALGIWALVYFVERKQNTAFLLLIPTTFFHPIVGAQLAILFACSHNWPWKFHQPPIWNHHFGLIAFISTAGLWLIALLHAQTQSIVNEPEISHLVLMETRMAHHFFPSYYPVKSWLLILTLLLVGTVLWRSRSPRLFRLLVICEFGLLVYFIGVEWLGLSILLNVQWFKTTVWLKPLALLACTTYLDEITRISEPKYLTRSLLAGILLISVLQLSDGWRLVEGRPFQVPGADRLTPEMKFSVEASRALPSDACLIVPPHVTAMRYFGRRSLYIDYKSSAHDKKYLTEAFLRRRSLYGMDLALRRSGKDMVAAGNAYYHNLTTTDFSFLKSKGVTHIMVERPKELDLTLVLQDSIFAVYEL